MNDLVQSLLPRNEVSIIAGASGAGKTSVIMQLLHAIQHNKPYFGLSVDPTTRVSYIAADRGGESLEHWSKIMDVDLSLVPIISLIKDESINLNTLKSDPMRLLDQLIKRLKTNHNSDLIIIDPMIIFFGADTKNYTANAQCLIYLNRLAHQLNVTIFGTHHAVKARTDFGFKRPQDRISGTGAFLGYSSSQIFLDTPEESNLPHHTLHIISHTAPGFSIPIIRDEHGIFQPFESDDSKFYNIVLSSIPYSGSVTTAEVAEYVESAGGSKRVAEFYLTKLKREGLVQQPSHGRYQRLGSQQAAA